MEARKQKTLSIIRRAVARDQRQGGFTMVEILVGIAVVAGILVWVAGRAHLLGSTSDATTEAGNVNLLRTQVRSGKTSAGYGPSGADLGDALIASNQLPSTFTTSGTNILNPWNVAYVIKSTGYGFTLQDTVPVDACAKMVVMQSQTGDWSSISVNGSPMTLPATQQAAGNACNAGNANVVLMTSNT